MRVVSLLPAATEIVAALDMLDHLVAVSHECDYPEGVAAKPHATHCPIHGGGLASRDIDRWVTDTLAATGTLYTMDEALIRRLAPDVILTQRLCDVCAVGLAQPSGVEATSVEQSGPAAAAGVREGDVVVALAGQTIGTIDDIHRALNTWPLGSALELRVLRHGELHALTVTPRLAQG